MSALGPRASRKGYPRDINYHRWQQDRRRDTYSYQGRGGVLLQEEWPIILRGISKAEHRRR